VTTDFEAIGGEAPLRAIIDDFVDRIFDDLMIGFFFARASRERIKEFEYQHAAAHLGGPVAYEGQPLEVAHGKHRIMGGHFERRKKILSDVLVAHGVDEGVRQRWIAHVESLRSRVTGHAGSACD